MRESLPVCLSIRFLREILLQALRQWFRQAQFLRPGNHTRLPIEEPKARYCLVLQPRTPKGEMIRTFPLVRTFLLATFAVNHPQVLPRFRHEFFGKELFWLTYIHSIQYVKFITLYFISQPELFLTPRSAIDIMEIFNMAEKSRQENPLPPDTTADDITRRQLFRAAREVGLGAVAFELLSESNPAEAAEFREGMPYIEGIKIAMQEAREGLREKDWIFVRMKGESGGWYLPVEGTAKNVVRELGPLFEKFGEAMKKGQVETIVHLHVHPILTQANYDMGLTPAIHQAMKDGKRPFPASPPSRNVGHESASFESSSDANFIPAWTWKMHLKKYGVDSRYQFAEIAADCVGLWKYLLDENLNNPHNRYIEKMRPMWDEWDTLIRKKLKGFQREEREERDEVERKLLENDPETVAKYITPKDVLIHQQRMLQRHQEDEREKRFVKTYWNFVQKSLERTPRALGPGITNTPREFDPKAYQELISTYEEVGFTVSFTSYAELGLLK